MTRPTFRWSLTVVLTLPFIIAACGGGGGGGGGGGTSKKDEGFRVVSSTSGFAVARDVEVLVEFVDQIRPESLAADTFRLAEELTGRVVRGALSVDADVKTLRFKPDSRLALNTPYQIVVTTDVVSRFDETMTKNFVGRFFTVVSDEAPPPPAPAPVFEFKQVDSMRVGRSSHTLTRLSNGTVLVLGGFSAASQVTNAAEIFDPVTRSFTRIPRDMVVGRAQHTATLLANGRVLITGGVVGDGTKPTSRVEIYDPVTQTFGEVTSNLAQERAYHTATTLEDGRILVAAGASLDSKQSLVSSRSAEIYDPSTGTFTTVGQLSTFRSSHRATRLLTGDVLITGGNSSSTVAEIFDPKSNSWTNTNGALTAVRSDHSATLRIDGSVLIYGGGDRSSELYNPVTKRFTKTIPTPLADRTAHTATRLIDGRVLIAGGYTWMPSLIFHATAEIFTREPDNRIFFTSEPLKASMALHRAVLLTNGDVLLSGGANTDPQGLELSVAFVYTTQ